MSKISRRMLLSSSAAAAGVCTIGNISGCKTVAPDSTVSKKIRSHPLEGIERENIKITDVKVTLLSCKLPFEKQWYTDSWQCIKRDSVLVELFTDKGIVGIGGSHQSGGHEEIKKYTEDTIRPSIIGKNPFDVEFLTSGGVSTYGEQFGWAGVDAACWDIIGKAKNMPVYKLLAIDNAPDPHIRIYASAGCNYAWFKHPEDLIDEAVHYKEKGFTAYKFRLGTSWGYSNITLKEYVPLLEKLRKAVGPDFDLIQEANMRLTLEQCLELSPVLEELKFLWLEEPLNTRNEGAIEGYIKINESLPTVMVSGGEGRVNRFEFKEWIDRDAYDIVQAECMKTGITEAWYIAHIANFNGKYYCPVNWQGGLGTMANAHLEAAIPNRLVLEYHTYYNLLEGEIFKEPLVVKNGYMDLPDKPGFGVELVSDVAQKFEYIPRPYTIQNPDMK